MTDEEYIFQSISREAKRNARGSRNKKRGSRSKSCRLPSDSLTKKQLEKLNGKVETIVLSDKKTWEEFKKLSPSLQEEYINNLIGKYGARGIDIAEMMGVKNGTLSKYSKNHNLKLNFGATGKRTADTRWLEFIGTNKVSTSTEPPTKEDKENVVQEPKIKKYEKGESVNTTAGSLKFIGAPVLAFFKTAQMLDENKNYEIVISFKEVQNADPKT